MSHFSVVVMLPEDTADTDSAVRKLMAPFERDIQVRPYKLYLSQLDIDQLARRFSLQIGELSEIASRLRDIGEEAGVDATGLFLMDTCNPTPKWDWYKILEVYPTLANVKTNLLPFAVLTPTGEWHEHFQDETTGEWQDTESWRVQFFALLDRFPTSVAAHVTCHG